jgi:hypothetical protein
LILIGSKNVLSNKKIKSILIEINDKFKSQKIKILRIASTGTGQPVSLTAVSCQTIRNQQNVPLRGHPEHIHIYI